MKRKVQKLIPLTLGVLSISFVLGYLVLAWTGPIQNPPQGNVPAPINVGDVDQYKTGKLGVFTNGVDINYGLTVGSSAAPGGVKATGNSYVEGTFQVTDTTLLATNGGNVGIATTTPDSKFKLVVDGKIGTPYIVSPKDADLNRDYAINFLDYALLKWAVKEGGAFGCTPGESCWDRIYTIDYLTNYIQGKDFDLNGDGTVDMRDIAQITSQFTPSGQIPFADEEDRRDINKDGFVDSKDIWIVVNSFGCSGSECEEWLKGPGGNYVMDNFGNIIQKKNADVNLDGVIDIRDVSSIARFFQPYYYFVASEYQGFPAGYFFGDVIIKDGILSLGEIASTPATTMNEGKLYVKTDGDLYFLKEDGTEINLSAGATGGGGYWSQLGSSLYPTDITWNVGIGTISPNWRLTVVGGDEPLAVKKGDYYFFVGVNRGGGDYVDIGAYHSTLGWRNLILNRDGGNVGIGTTNPQAKLHIEGGGGEVVRIGSGGDFLFYTSNNSGRVGLYCDNDGELTVGYGGNLKVTHDLTVWNNLILTKNMDQIIFTAGNDDWWIMSKGAPTDNKAFAVYSPGNDGGSYSGWNFYVEEDGDVFVTGNLNVDGTAYIRPPYAYDIETTSWKVPESSDAGTYYNDPYLSTSITVPRNSRLIIWVSGSLAYSDEDVPLLSVADPHTWGYYRITVDGNVCSGSRRNHESPTAAGGGSSWGDHFDTMCVYWVTPGTHTIRLQFADDDGGGARVKLGQRTLFVIALSH